MTKSDLVLVNDCLFKAWTSLLMRSMQKAKTKDLGRLCATGNIDTK